MVALRLEAQTEPSSSVPGFKSQVSLSIVRALLFLSMVVLQLPFSENSVFETFRFVSVTPCVCAGVGARGVV